MHNIPQRGEDMKKNGKIELLRFMFSIGVLCFHIQKYLPGEISLKNGIHFDFFPHGAIGVEFFFVVSGFLMASSVFYASQEKKQIPLGIGTVLFIKNKFVSLLPMRLIVFSLLFTINVFLNSWSFSTIITKLISNIPGLFLLHMSGFGNIYINHIEWYLSVMIIGMFVIYPLLRRNYDVFSKIVAPLIAFFILGYMYKTYGRLTGVASWEGLYYRSMLRGIAELCVGVVAFEVCLSVKKLDFNTFQKFLFTCFEFICWTTAFTMIMLTLPREYEFYMLIAIAAGTVCSFSGQSYCSDLFNNKVCFYLGKLSLPIYLCQLIPIALVPNYLSNLSMIQQMAITFIFTIILSIALFHLTNAISKRRKRLI